MTDRLKTIIFDKLYKDLSHVEIIPYKDSIWFIDRENKEWYFEYVKPDKLWWRWGYFNDFFLLFSMQPAQFVRVITEWVEDVLNYKVNTPYPLIHLYQWQVEEVLNYKVNTPLWSLQLNHRQMKEVEEVLNYKVNTPQPSPSFKTREVREVLNYKITKTIGHKCVKLDVVVDILNCKVSETSD